MYRHKKTNRIYKVLSLALSKKKKKNTLEAAIVYQSVDDGLVWTRLAKTFFDGRFEKVEEANDTEV